MNHGLNTDHTQAGFRPTDGVAIPRMNDGIWISILHGSFYPWYCHAIRGLLPSVPFQKRLEIKGDSFIKRRQERQPRNTRNTRKRKKFLSRVAS